MKRNQKETAKAPMDNEEVQEQVTNVNQEGEAKTGESAEGVNQEGEAKAPEAPEQQNQEGEAKDGGTQDGGSDGEPKDGDTDKGEVKDEITVIIPYKKPTMTPESLHLVVKAWRKYAQFPFKLVIIGDMPDFDTTDIECVPDSDSAAHFHIMVCKSLMEYFSKNECSSFILAHDDEVPLQPFMPDDLKATAFEQFPDLDSNSDNNFIADMARTVELVEKCNRKPVFFSGHAPHVYDKVAFMKMVEAYHLDEVGIDYEVLYHCLENTEPVYLAGPFDNGYSFLIMQFDDLDWVKARLMTHKWCSFGGSCTSQAYYDIVAKYLEA